MRQALDSLGRLQEEVGKLWIELRAANGEHAPRLGGGGGVGEGACWLMQETLGATCSSLQ